MLQEDILANEQIKKIVLKPGTITPEWEKGSNALFHYTVHAYVKPTCQHGCAHEKDHQQDRQEPSEDNAKPVRKLISDSKEADAGKPFELRIGYNFTVKAMELCVKSMSIGEKSRFLCMGDSIDV